MRFPHNASSHRKQRCCACAVCGNELTRNLIGRHKKFCSDHCRVEAHRTKHVGRLPNRNVLQRLKNGARYPHEGLQRNDSKSACGTGANFQKNSGRPPDIQAPRHVIEGEIGGRGWIGVISTDGVRSFMRSIGKGISARDAAP
jgi:hypothetical protein